MPPSRNTTIAMRIGIPGRIASEIHEPAGIVISAYTIDDTDCSSPSAVDDVFMSFPISGTRIQ